MNALFYTLSALLLLSGCSQPKNRLADNKNLEYQKKIAAKNSASAAAQVEVVDIPTAPDSSENTQSKKQVGVSTLHYLSYDELVAILTALGQNFTNKEEVNTLIDGFVNVEDNPEIDTKKLLPQAKMNDEGLSAAILYDGKPLTMIENGNVTLDGKLLKMEASNGFKFHAACALEKCDLLFIGFLKYKGDKLSMNLSSLFKKVGDQYQIAVRKPKAYYDEEAKKRAQQTSATAQK